MRCRKGLDGGGGTRLADANRTHPASLLRLAENPYMLFMLVDVYRASGRSLPANRGELFDSFVETLLLRERLFGIELKTQSITRTPTGEAALPSGMTAVRSIVRAPEGVALLGSLTELAYEMQRQRVHGWGGWRRADRPCPWQPP